MSLPIFQSAIKELTMLQTKWSSILNPLVDSPTNKNIILANVVLINGATSINHHLGRRLTGWKIIRQRAAAAIYDTQDSNTTPELTLQLQSSAAVTIDLEVF